MVEVLTVVAVMGVLASIAVPNLSGGNDRRTASAAARQAMMAFRLARSEAISRQKNVAIQVRAWEMDSEINVYVTADGRDFSDYNPLFHMMLRRLSPYIRRGEDRSNWPRKVYVGDGDIINGLEPLPEAYAVAEPKACSFCAGSPTIFATPQGRFVDSTGRPVIGSFTVARRDRGVQKVWLTKVVAFNGLTGSSRIFTWRGQAWR